jgi:DNA polymerase (family 10)
MNNAEIATVFDSIADLLEFEGANAFRVRAYRNAARTIEDYPESLANYVRDPQRKLTDLVGIGDDLSQKITALLTTGSLPMLDELRARIPPGVLQMLRVPGLGPKKAAALFKELGVSSLVELRAACEAQKVRALKGFGAKTEATILAGLDFAQSEQNQRLYWSEADIIAQRLREYLSGVTGMKRLEFAGSYRRGKETVGDLDILVDAADVTAVMSRFAEYPGIEAVLGRGETKMSIRLRDGLQVDLRVVPTDSFGAALQYFTGSKEHNVTLRGRAKDAGLRINEYGVYRVEHAEAKGKTKKPMKKKDDAEANETSDETLTWIAGKTEEDVYATLGLPWIPPELRENRREYEEAANGTLPQLIELGDLQGDLHMHTTASDGANTIAEMIAAAQARGLKYIAITDHSQRVSMANGLNGERLLAQWAEIDKLNKTLKGFTVLKGVEVDILEAGGLDIADDVLKEADWIVGSVHYGQNQPREQITKRIVDALANPWLSAIGHPTGRLINKRKSYAVDLDAVYAATKEHGKALELNANPARLDLDDVACAAAKRHGIPIVISSDAHSQPGMDVLRYGILQARRAGLTKDDVLNTLPWAKAKQRVTRG